LILFVDPDEQAAAARFLQEEVPEAVKPRDLERYVWLKLPMDAEVTEKGKRFRLLEHGAFQHMYGRQGVAVVDYANVDASFYGGEAKATLALTETLFLDSGLSYVRGKKETDPARNIRDEDVAEIPPLRVRLALRYDTGVYFGELEGIASATQDRVDSDLGESKTSGWGIVNLKVGGERGNLRAVAGVENLFDKFYYEHLSYLRDPFSTGVRIPEPGRSLYVTLSYLF